MYISKVNQRKKEKYVVPALRQKRKEHVDIVPDVNETAKFYHDHDKSTYVFIGESPIQIAQVDKVEPMFRTPCHTVKAVEIQI